MCVRLCAKKPGVLYQVIMVWGVVCKSVNKVFKGLDKGPMVWSSFSLVDVCVYHQCVYVTFRAIPVVVAVLVPQDLQQLVHAMHWYTSVFAANPF